MAVPRQMIHYTRRKLNNQIIGFYGFQRDLQHRRTYPYVVPSDQRWVQRTRDQPYHQWCLKIEEKILARRRSCQNQEQRTDGEDKTGVRTKIARVELVLVVRHGVDGSHQGTIITVGA